MTQVTIPEGWYPDNTLPDTFRYWDGWQWTGYILTPQTYWQNWQWTNFFSTPQTYPTVDLKGVRRRALATWLVFGLLISIAPVLFHVIELAAKHELHSGWDAFSTGEVIIIAAVLAAASVGDFLRRKATSLTTRQLSVVGFAALLLLFCGWLYCFVQSDSAKGQAEFVGWCCIAPAVCSLVIVASSLLVEPEEGPR